MWLALAEKMGVLEERRTADSFFRGVLGSQQRRPCKEGEERATQFYGD